MSFFQGAWTEIRGAYHQVHDKSSPSVNLADAGSSERAIVRLQQQPTDPTTGHREPVVLYDGVPKTFPGSNSVHLLPLDEQNTQMYLISQQTLVSTDSSHTMKPWDLVKNPQHVLKLIYRALIDTGKYVVWNYVDFVEQFRTWNGTWLGLLQHTGLVWRSFVTLFLTLGIVEAAPILMALWNILSNLMEVFYTLFRWTYETIDELLYLMEVLWNDAMSIVGRITSSV